MEILTTYDPERDALWSDPVLRGSYLDAVGAEFLAFEGAPEDEFFESVVPGDAAGDVARDAGTDAAESVLDDVAADSTADAAYGAVPSADDGLEQALVTPPLAC